MKTLLRGRLLTFHADPAETEDNHRYIEDGALVVEIGRFAALGRYSDLAAPEMVEIDHRPNLILPGFIDPHIHFPQVQVIASWGVQLLDWLNRYTFPAEGRYADPAHAEPMASAFLDLLLAHGTTTACAFASVHPASVDALMSAAEARSMMMLAGKVMMDRNAPAGLTDGAQRGYDESKALIARWRGRGRLDYAVTPRFAVTSTEAQLEASGALLRETPGLYMQTHLDENHAEIAFVKQQFAWTKTYLGVYERYGLLGPRSIFGHCLHLEASEVEALAASRSVAAFCPTSNLFLGSGLFDLRRLDEAGVRVALATDVGGGTSYSMLQTAAEAYKVLQMNGQSWPAAQAFYQMTLGNARALGLEDRIGAIREGLEADLVVLDSRATPAMAHRMASVAGDLAEELFVLMIMGDDRAVSETYVAGRPAKSQAGA